MRDGAGSFYRTELALAHRMQDELRALLKAAERRFPSRLGPGDACTVKGVPAVIHGVYFTAGRVQYRLSDGTSAEQQDVAAVVPPVPEPISGRTDGNPTVIG